MAGIQPEQEQQQESHILPSGSLLPADASNSEPNPPSTTIVPALTRDKIPAATSCNLLSWFRHPLAAFRASLKRRRCASSGNDNPKVVERKKKVQILGIARAEEMAMAQQEKKAPGSSITSDPEVVAELIPNKAIGATIVDCLNDDDVYVKKVATLHPSSMWKRHSL